MAEIQFWRDNQFIGSQKVRNEGLTLVSFSKGILFGVISYGEKTYPVSERKGGRRSHARFFEGKHTFAIGV